MKRLFIGLFLLSALVATQPVLRAEVGSRVEPIVTRSGFDVPSPSSLLDPLFRWSARNELRSLRRQLEQVQRTGGRLPKPLEFGRYMRSTLMASSGTDPWSTPYHLVIDRRGARVVSAGPDRELGTADDLQESLAPL